MGLALQRFLGRPLRLGSTLIVARHADVTDGLSRDLDFCLRPINAPKFDQIGFHFILGMDRSSELIAERRALYTALAAVDAEALKAAATTDIKRQLAAAGTGPLDIIEEYARPVAAATAQRLFGLQAADPVLLMDVTRAIFGNSFLNASGDTAMTDRALATANLLSGWLDAEISRRQGIRECGGDMLGALLSAGAQPDLIRRTLGGMVVGAIDTTATCVAKIVSVLMSDGALLKRVRKDVSDPVRMRGWCDEALRWWPHGPLLVRRAARDTTLGGAAVKEGDTVLLWTQAAMLDPAAFPEPFTLRPERADARYLHLGGGLHPCAGRGVNAWQIPLLVANLVARAPTRLGRMEWAGPFPARLPLFFESRTQ